MTRLSQLPHTWNPATNIQEFHAGSSQYPGDRDDFDTYLGRFRTRNLRDGAKIPPLVIEQQLSKEPPALTQYLPTNAIMIEVIKNMPIMAQTYLKRIINLNNSWFAIHRVGAVGAVRNSEGLNWTSDNNFYNKQAHRKYFHSIQGCRIDGQLRNDCFFVYARTSPSAYTVYAVQLTPVTDVPSDKLLDDVVTSLRSRFSFPSGVKRFLVYPGFTIVFSETAVAKLILSCSLSSLFVLWLSRF